MINFFKENWQFIFVFVMFITYIIINIKDFSKLSKQEQIDKIKEWLLWAVTEAEKKFGAGTGQLKLSYVYSLFIDKFPNSTISFELFSKLVDEVLDKFRLLLSQNSNINQYVQSDQQED